MNNLKKNVLIYGASGHGKVIADILEKNGKKILGFIDDNPEKWGQPFFGYEVLGGRGIITKSKKNDSVVIIGIGDNILRKKVAHDLMRMGIEFTNAIHPSAQFGRNVQLGYGVVAMACSVINSDTSIGNHCIINTAATIDHDNIIEDFVHISPGAHLGGGVKVQESSWIGLGASIINNITIGKTCIVGAGSVVINNIDSDSIVAGNPARSIKK